MASKLIVLLSLALVSCAYAAPAKTEQAADTTTGGDDGPILEVVEVIEDIPTVEIVDIPTSTQSDAKEAVHKVVKRSALRGDNPSNDLLANYDGLLFETGQSSLDGRRIKFLPTWLG